MPDWTAVGREHVLAALEEYDRLGGERFRREYGFGTSRSYTLLHGGRDYDSKAVLGAAHRYATGRAAARSEFSGGRTGAAKVLTDLGFEVTEPGRATQPPQSGSTVAVETCPSCHLTLPRSGVCDNCA